jgi:hypothetical protein
MIVKYNFKSSWRQLEDLSLSDAEYKTVDVSDLIVLHDSYLSNGSSLIFLSLTGKDDLVKLAKFGSLVNKLGGHSRTKLFVVNFAMSNQYEEILLKTAPFNFIDPNIQAKALKYKVDATLKILKKNISTVDTTKKVIEKTQESRLETKKKVEINWEEPLENDCDIWIFENESSCKNIMGRWLLKIFAPSSYVANWVEVSGKMNTWSFTFKDGGNKFISSVDGTWFFKGQQKPEFLWRENLWLISGNEFELFYEDKTNKIYKIKLSNEKLSIAKNSRIAALKSAAILDSFNKDIKFKASSEGKAVAGSFDIDHSSLDSLRGQSTTDHVNHSPLAGKSSTSNIDLSGLGLDVERELEMEDLELNVENIESDFGEATQYATGHGDELEINQENGNNSAKPLGHSSSPDKIEKYYRNKTHSLEKKEEQSVDIGKTSEVESDIFESAYVSSVMIFEGKRFEVMFDDSFDDTITFISTDAADLSGESIVVQIDFNYLDKKSSISLKGKVESFDRVVGENEAYVSMKVFQESIFDLERFKELFEARQKNTNKFMKLAQGVG